MQTLTLQQPWLQLPDCFYRPVRATPLKVPNLIHCNQKVADLLGLSVKEMNQYSFIQFLNGELSSDSTGSIATVYAGHQFGIYTAQLGDGRALLLGEIEGRKGESFEIQIKGGGLTPFSRTLDGRLTLSEGLREYLGSEALAGLGIPTTRSLCLLGSQEGVLRERREPAVILVRMARSHIRFGHFEYFYHRDELSELSNLIDFVIDRLYPELKQEASKMRPLRLLETIFSNTARMIAGWQAVGFVHGVMNTDNMSVFGDTLDLGPFGFMGGFDGAYTANSADDQQRYQYDQQPEIGRWNCLALAGAFLPMLPGKTIPAGLLRHYRLIYQEYYLRTMRAKLGLVTQCKEDAFLIESLLKTLAQGNIDYPYFFRLLGKFCPKLRNIELLALSSDRHRLLDWLRQYEDRLAKEPLGHSERKQLMDWINPCYVLRDHLLEEVLVNAELGDFSAFTTLLNLLQNPFQEIQGKEYFALPSNQQTERGG
jgi:protein adenylyltransferase